MQHHFNVEIAKTFGVNIAIFLDHMSFWITKNLTNELHLHDGSCWTRNTLKAYQEMFPYLSVKQIRKVLSDCEKYDLIKIGNYNKIQYDRTGWYALTEKSSKLLNISILPKGQMDCDKRANGSVQKGTTIPITNTVTNTVTKRESRKKIPVPSNFYPNDDHFQLGKELGINVLDALPNFIDWYKGKGDKKEDWNSIFNIWIRRENKHKNKSTFQKKETGAERAYRLAKPTLDLMKGDRS